MKITSQRADLIIFGTIRFHILCFIGAIRFQSLSFYGKLMSGDHLKGVRLVGFHNCLSVQLFIRTPP